VSALIWRTFGDVSSLLGLRNSDLACNCDSASVCKHSGVYRIGGRSDRFLVRYYDQYSLSVEEPVPTVMVCGASTVVDVEVEVSVVVSVVVVDTVDVEKIVVVVSVTVGWLESVQ
jgi:hypothetical protein